MAKQSDIHIKTKRLVEDGLEVLKSGWHGAEVVAGKTYQASKLHLGNGKAHIDLYRALHDLGMAAHYEIKQAQGESFIPSANLIKLNAKVKELEKAINKTEQKLSKLSIVEREKKSSPVTKHEQKSAPNQGESNIPKNKIDGAS